MGTWQNWRDKGKVVPGQRKPRGDGASWTEESRERRRTGHAEMQERQAEHAHGHRVGVGLYSKPLGYEINQRGRKCLTSHSLFYYQIYLQSWENGVYHKLLNVWG